MTTIDRFHCVLLIIQPLCMVKYHVIRTDLIELLNLQEGDLFKWKMEHAKPNLPQGGYIIGKVKPKSSTVDRKRLKFKNRK